VRDFCATLLSALGHVCVDKLLDEQDGDVLREGLRALSDSLMKASV